MCYSRFQEDGISMLKSLKENGNYKLQEYFHYSVLAFDEMATKAILEWNKKRQKPVGPHEKLQAVVIRGLFHS